MSISYPSIMSVTKAALFQLRMLSPIIGINLCQTKVHQDLAAQLKLVLVICVDGPTTTSSLLSILDACIYHQSLSILSSPSVFLDMVIIL